MAKGKKTKKQKRSKPKKLFMGLSATDMLSLGALGLPAIDVLFSQNTVKDKVTNLKRRYLAYDDVENKFTSNAVMATAGTYGSAIIPKIGKKALSALGLRSGKI